MEWLGLPKGVKFDPSDEELLWHLLAETGKGAAKPHPFISKFIITLDKDFRLDNIHPRFLPGVKQDGSMSYFFHKKLEISGNRQMKKQKKRENFVDICWHRIGKLKPVYVDGIHQGSKEVFSLYINPVSCGNPVKTSWSMHQYYIGLNGDEEGLAVSKFFFKRSKQDFHDLLSDSEEGFVAEVIDVAAPLQVAPEFHQARLLVDPSKDASAQIADCSLGRETDDVHTSSSQNAVKYLQKARINLHQQSEGIVTTDELPLLESFCEAAAEISVCSISANSEITVKDQKERLDNRTDSFLGNLRDSGNTSSDSIYDKVKDEDTFDSNVAHISKENSCSQRSSKNTLGRFVVSKLGKIDTTGVCSFARKKHDVNSKCLDDAHVLLHRTSNAEHGNAHQNFVILGLPAYNIKSKPSEESESNSGFGRNSSYGVNISAQSALPIKIEPKYFEDSKVRIAPGKISDKNLDASAPSESSFNVKDEPFEETKPSIIVETCVEFPNYSQSSHPLNFSSTSNSCLSTSSIQGKNIPYSNILREGAPSCYSIHQTSTREGLEFPRAESLSTTASDIDELPLKPPDLINQLPDKDDSDYDGMSIDNSRAIGNSEYFGQSTYPQITVQTGKLELNLVISSSSPNVKSEPVESSLQTCSTPSCNFRGHAPLMFENTTEFPNDFQLDILDHVPLKYRMGIPASESVVNAKSGTVPGELASATPGCRSVDTKERISTSRKRRKRTATDSVEKAMDEDAPGLLQFLLDRGIQVEEIKLYGNLEDNDLLEMSSSQECFEDLETVMTKLFSERSSLLRFTMGRSEKGSKTVYCLTCLISLIEQARYMRFREKAIEWGWCRELQSFIFVFQAHNRIVLERPEYGYATYFFELLPLPIDWQIKRLVMALKLPICARSILLENKPLIVGEDLSEGEACVLEAYGWNRNTGFGTLLNYCDRVMHDRRTLMHSSEWRAKIGRLLMNGYDGGRVVMPAVPEKVSKYFGEAKMEPFASPEEYDTVPHILNEFTITSSEVG